MFNSYGEVIAINSMHPSDTSIRNYNYSIPVNYFIKVADYWGDDTESYWAFEQANNILDSISDYSKYE